MGSIYDQIKTPKDALQLIVDIGYDYDGMVSVNGLKQLIDELIEIAKIGLDTPDSVSFENY